MFAFHSYICQGNSLFFDIYGFLGLFLIGTCLNGFLCICRSCFCKRCCFVSELYNGCCCLVLCNYGCLCCGCCCQCNRCNNCCCLSGAAFLCIIGTSGLTFSTCRCSGCRCRSQTLDHLIQLSACLIQAAQNLLQSIFCILFVLFSHGQLSFQFLQSSKVTGSVTLQSFDLCLQLIDLSLRCFHVFLCVLCIL